MKYFITAALIAFAMPAWAQIPDTDPYQQQPTLQQGIRDGAIGGAQYDANTSSQYNNGVFMGNGIAAQREQEMQRQNPDPAGLGGQRYGHDGSGF